MCACAYVYMYVCVYMYAVGLLLSAQFRGFEAEVWCAQFLWSAVPFVCTSVVRGFWGQQTGAGDGRGLAVYI